MRRWMPLLGAAVALAMAIPSLGARAVGSTREPEDRGIHGRLAEPTETRDVVRMELELRVTKGAELETLKVYLPPQAEDATIVGVSDVVVSQKRKKEPREAKLLRPCEPGGTRAAARLSYAIRIRAGESPLAGASALARGKDAAATVCIHDPKGELAALLGRLRTAPGGSSR